jgi:hypothetical protein
VCHRRRVTGLCRFAADECHEPPPGCTQRVNHQPCLLRSPTDPRPQSYAKRPPGGFLTSSCWPGCSTRPVCSTLPVVQGAIIRCDLSASLRVARPEHHNIITDAQPTVALPPNQLRPRRVVEALAEVISRCRCNRGDRTCSLARGCKRSRRSCSPWIYSGRFQFDP